jgi:hypothetical protein
LSWTIGMGEVTAANQTFDRLLARDSVNILSLGLNAMPPDERS